MPRQMAAHIGESGDERGLNGNWLRFVEKARVIPNSIRPQRRCHKRRLIRFSAIRIEEYALVGVTANQLVDTCTRLRTQMIVSDRADDAVPCSVPGPQGHR